MSGALFELHRVLATMSGILYLSGWEDLEVGGEIGRMNGDLIVDVSWMPRHMSRTCSNTHPAVAWEGVTRKEGRSKLNDSSKYHLYGQPRSRRSIS